MVAVTLQEGPTDLPLEAIPQVILLLEGCSYLCPIFLRKSIPLVIFCVGGGGTGPPVAPLSASAHNDFGPYFDMYTLT